MLAICAPAAYASEVTGILGSDGGETISGNSHGLNHSSNTTTVAQETDSSASSGTGADENTDSSVRDSSLSSAGPQPLAYSPGKAFSGIQATPRAAANVAHAAGEAPANDPETLSPEENTAPAATTPDNNNIALAANALGAGTPIGRMAAWIVFVGLLAGLAYYFYRRYAARRPF